MKRIKQKLKITKILMIIVGFFIIGNVVLLGANAVKAAGVNYVTQSQNIKAPEATNFLIVGTDLGGNRNFKEDGVRTDVMMIVSLVPNNELGHAEVNIVNIPRDVTTAYSCGGTGKINGAAYTGASIAYANGSSDDEAEAQAVDCTIGTVEDLFDITIDYHLFVNFDSFITLVDGIGGIDVINQYEFCEQDENGKADAYCFDEGEIHLGGGEALAFVRQRHYSSDYERGQRQQLVLSKILMKVLANPTRYSTAFAKAVIADTTNNLSLDLMLSLLNWGSQTFNNVMEDMSYGTPVYIDVKSSPFSNDTGFNLTDSIDDNLGYSNTGTYPIYDIYDSYEDIEQSTNVTRYMFNRESLGLPTKTTTEKLDDANVLEVQFISVLVNEENTSSGFYSYVDDYTAAYINTQLNNNEPSSSNDIDDVPTEV